METITLIIKQIFSSKYSEAVASDYVQKGKAYWSGGRNLTFCVPGKTYTLDMIERKVISATID